MFKKLGFLALPLLTRGVDVFQAATDAKNKLNNEFVRPAERKLAHDVRDNQGYKNLFGAEDKQKTSYLDRIPLWLIAMQGVGCLLNINDGALGRAYFITQSNGTLNPLTFLATWFMQVCHVLTASFPALIFLALWFCVVRLYLNWREQNQDARQKTACFQTFFNICSAVSLVFCGIQTMFGLFQGIVYGIFLILRFFGANVGLSQVSFGALPFHASGSAFQLPALFAGQTQLAILVFAAVVYLPVMLFTYLQARWLLRKSLLVLREQKGQLDKQNVAVDARSKIVEHLENDLELSEDSDF